MSRESPRRIAHLDMDAFYASVELLRYPQLRGLAVVIGGGSHTRALLEANAAGRPRAEIPLSAFPRLKGYKGRGVITTATYAARQSGVGSAMGMMKAAALCPDAILLPVDFEEYKRYSRLFKTTVAEIASVIEDRGIDEIYIDFTSEEGVAEDGGRALATRLQTSIRERTGLTCSIGVAPNKLLAKMAGEFDKPNGITILFERDLEARIWPLSIRKVNGIGPRAEEKLHAAGIKTLGDIATRERAWLVEHFGQSYGAWLHDASHGRDDRQIVTSSEPVSMSRETTFERDLHPVKDRAMLSSLFTDLCTRLAADLSRKGFRGKTIGIKLRYEDFSIVSRAASLDLPTDDAVLIRQTAGRALKRAPLDKRLRLLGVRVGNLTRANAEPPRPPELPLFQYAGIEVR
ncbi:MAG: DNA polymerase IV [Polyangiaceae bacterium]|nr:DNA polymerase IV [Polyangiaceae bacterium]